MFSGSIVALLTPFKNGKVDEKAFQSFVDWQINQGTSGLVPVGTTGESPTLSHEEHMRVVELCVEAAAGRVPVIAGAGSNSTAEAVAFTRHAKQAGADAVLQVTPYYNKPTQEGLYQHYKAIHDAAEIPIVIYNIPGRSVIDMSVSTMARLAKLPNIVGVKDATADLTRPLRTRLEIGPEFCQLTGEDASVVAFLAQGGHGCISVTGNVAPAQSAQLHAAWQAKDWATVERLRDQLMPLHNALFLETSPAPVKYAASLLGICSEELRLPVVPVTEATRVAVREAMVKAGVLN
ncbi:4-hydroxy-tetrahydrodipicolinate synthase [Skermanella aerolata]|jgi:4-hydroxy-tetrahydrodipicolinate synthase|uniref:4-hydroxy-tetrahydrodipicolinate synthase n=1 Tax=Skermanella aerolata TaxID=393310 RepID=A0A512DJQ9_9PROT|nr:4-hydroxy-tetrahydrodipicolinate synthase [Skermanella aerolata]KJB97086.1 dihydrodipicolinate synthase [Skermanella aerolata KACC 11604]GEO36717.1 4-hydroxy-tetrahydrodipicolinate synthase [Skermanella aerolata]